MAKRRPAGDGLVRKRADGRWEGRIVVGHKEDGSPIFRSVFAKTQKEVMRKLHSQIEAYRDVELTEASNMTLGEWLDKWLSDYMTLTVRESTLEGYKTITNHYIKPHLGDAKIGSVTTADIQKMYNWLRENGRVNEHYEKGNALSDSMIRRIHMMLHQAMDAAVREHLIVKNPTQGTVIPKTNYAPKQILSGTLGPDERIPSVREYSAEIGVNPNTIMRSYEKLTADGIIYNKRGIGYFISPDARETVLEAQRKEFMEEELPQILRRMKLLGIDPSVLAG